jgi:hypothetical protein
LCDGSEDHGAHPRTDYPASGDGSGAALLALTAAACSSSSSTSRRLPVPPVLPQRAASEWCIYRPLAVTSSEKLMMISQGLTIFEGTISKVSYNLLMAGSLIAVVRVLVVALIVQRRVVEA